MANETLYNGIVLPDVWPPDRREFTHDPMPVPYLDHPPAVIPIDIGRQLFVDDLLIESSTLNRTFHKPDWHPAAPVLVPDRAWEAPSPGSRGYPSAMPFSDGVWYDPEDQRFKMWYYAGDRATCYAQSTDGLDWRKPDLDVVPGTNIVMKHAGRRDSATVWLDHSAARGERFKMLCYDLTRCEHDLFLSADGIHWNHLTTTGNAQDRTTLFYNPFRGRWCFNLRSTFFYNEAEDEWCYSLKSPATDEADKSWVPTRIRRYVEGTDLAATARSWPRLGVPQWRDSEEGREMAMNPTVWIGADRLDPPWPGSGYVPDLYCLEAVAYESLMVGLFSILRIEEPPTFPKRTDKINNICFGFSRDGFHWDRPQREPMLDVAADPTAWNHSNIQSVGGCFLVVDDKLHIYCSGRGGSTDSAGTGMACRTGLATLRRDGFASMDAGSEPGSLTMRPLSFKGSQLFVNLEAEDGELTAEVLDRDGQVIAPYSRENSIPVRGDSTSAPVQWKGAPDLSGFEGTPVRFRFFLKAASLYAFWVSSDPSGASQGYVAAGGPRFSGPIDTAGA